MDRCANIRFDAIGQERLHDQQLGTGKRPMFDRRGDGTEDMGKLHGCVVVVVERGCVVQGLAHSAAPRIRRSSTSVQRRWRVKVSGVVTPSPVGVAIEKEI